MHATSLQPTRQWYSQAPRSASEVNCTSQSQRVAGGANWDDARRQESAASAQALDGDAGNVLGKFSEIALASADDEVATKRCRGDYGRVDRIGASRAGQQFACAFSELRCQRLDSTAF